MLRHEAGGGNPLAAPCPRCGCAGNYVGHGRYWRHVVHRGREERVEVRRVRCAGCMSTHAVIPPGVVPYRAYSEQFVLAVLAAWASGASNARVRREFGISESTRRRMVSGARRRARALLSCGASRAAVDAALAAAGLGPVASMHMSEFGTALRGERQIRQSARRARRQGGALHITRRLAPARGRPHTRARARDGARRDERTVVSRWTRRRRGGWSSPSTSSG